MYLLLLISEVKLYAGLNSFYVVLKLQLKLVYEQSLTFLQSSWWYFSRFYDCTPRHFLPSLISLD